jgi:short-subunit dehydrogenase
MALELKPVKDQVIVITGASSGIGLVTARRAAKIGARLVVAARNETALESLVNEIRSAGGEAIAVKADVGHELDVAEIARAAIETFGGFDTWVNNAGIGLYGEMLEIPHKDSRRLFDTNFWGVVYGSLTAARNLRRRQGEYGGAIINVGSEVSERAIILLGMYSASKHAVKGFTDALRMELEAAKAPIVVTLVKPAAINTPFPKHARNYLDREPMLPAPVYAPEVVADAILHCAQVPERDVFVGGAAKLHAAQATLAPRLTDWDMEKNLAKKQQSDEAAHDRQDALYQPTSSLEERGNSPHHVRESSVYTQAVLHPWLTRTLVLGAGLMIAALARGVNGAFAKRGLVSAKPHTTSSTH